MISQWYALFVAMLGMMVTFTIWGALSPLATLFQTELLLNHTQVSILIAIPVLLGSVMRIPMGMLTDRYGGKRVFIALLVFSLLPTFVLGTLISSYSWLLVWAFVLGMAGTSFAVGIPFVSKWFPPGQQGLALGIFGIGNGAVFKLVPQFFDHDTGSVTGIVGAAGGLGGFFPPLFLGVSRDYFGSYTLGFLFLSGFSLLCLLVHSTLQSKHKA